ncbi:MAG TPA: STAS domain-containing protein [Gemmataceae bacterium]|nr:STAS domain-containing protein [Gemmataceae bacterium]
MSVHAADHWFDVEDREGISIVRFVVADLLDDETIDRIGEKVRDLIQRGGCRRLVLHFGSVRRMSSHMLGELVVLLKRMLAAGGKLVLGALAPELRATFTILRLDRIFYIRDTEEEALECCRES